MTHSARPGFARIASAVLTGALWCGETILAMEPPPTSACPPRASVEATSRSRSLFDGKSLAGWNMLDEFWFDKHGPVHVRAGEIVFEAGQPGTGIVWRGKALPEEYELTLRAQRLEGADFFCGLTFPVGKSHCTLILGGWGGSVTGLSNVDDAPAVENETTGHFPFKNKQWYAIRLRVTAGKVEVWVDREQLVDLEREDRRFTVWWEQEPARSLGIVSWNTKAAFKDIRLQPLEKPERRGSMGP